MEHSSQSIPDVESDNSSGESCLPTTTTVSSAGSPFTLPLSDAHDFKIESGPRIDLNLHGLFTENVAAKIWRVAGRLAETQKKNGIENYPEYVPSSGDSLGKYTTRPVKFWTCGFFPGSLYAVLERCMKYPRYLPSPAGVNRAAFQNQLLGLCRTWSEPLHEMASRTDTHDLGFITQPALRMDWELTGNHRSLQSVLRAAISLASRYDEKLGAVRSWDRTVSKRYEITDKETNFLVIVDSMCNLDLLFYSGHHSSNQKLIDIATSHAHFVLRTLVRADYSTFHVVNLDPQTGDIKTQFTHQGYCDDSTWARGQAWAILGFAQTYIWTKDPTFLSAATGLANYFLKRLSTATHSHPYVPLWDFDAPTTPTGAAGPLRDTSAGMIAANGLLLLHQILHSSSTSLSYLDAVLRIARETIDLALAPDGARFSPLESDSNIDGSKEVYVPESENSWDSILLHATANNNEFAMMRYSDHGLVYADYFFLELGNKMLRMGLV